jgi:hypothetical protein
MAPVVRRRLASLALILSVFGFSPTTAEELDSRLGNFDIAQLVRFENAEQAEAWRAEMIKFIWPEGLPDTRAQVDESIGECPELGSVDKRLIASIDRYDIEVGATGFESIVFVVHPKQPTRPARLALVHGGHMPDGHEHGLSLGLSDSIEDLLEHGFIVAAIQMPLVNWNKDTDGKLPSGRKFDIEGRRTRGHDELFAEVEPELKGQTLRFFLEPVVVATNELVARYPDYEALLMIGLSGGGWTTHLSAAVDPRIDLSIPVAGALPLYARPFSPGSKGDAEQEYPPLYREEDTDGDGVLDSATGVASWLEIFALGGVSPGEKPRHQVQVLNLHDSCCFGGTVHTTYAEQLTTRVKTIGKGSWLVFVDDTHRGHLISDHVIKTVLEPAIEGISKPTSHP